MQLWPHQDRGISEVLAAVADGHSRILLTSPTGMGKSVMICEIIDRLAAQGWYAVLYTNRRLLIEQLQQTLIKHGIDFGVRAAGYDEEEEFWPVQIASLPTEVSRSKRGQKVHGVGRKCIAVVDEAHLNDGPKTREVFAQHAEQNHVLLGVTATPVGLGETYDRLVIAGTVSEGRECGALVEAQHYGPDEPDFKAFKKLRQKVEAGENPSEKEAHDAMMRPGIFGRVWDHFERLNPDHKPTILFAPSVEASLWFAEKFAEKGVAAAHIDHDHIWRGELERSTPDGRADLLAASKDGRIVVLCNRFVLREGIDAPWLAHGIFATVFGSIQTYLQSGGRLLRAYDGISSVTVQDHGGNWWRFGSLNSNRAWHLNDTAASVVGKRADRLRQKLEREPFLCRQCGRVLTYGKCRGCGWEPDRQKRSRPVVAMDGTLKPRTGDIFVPRRLAQKPDAVKHWSAMYYRGTSRKWNATFKQMEATYARENNWFWPDHSWPLMPVHMDDFYRRAKDVPVERLRGSEQAKANAQAHIDKTWGVFAR